MLRAAEGWDSGEDTDIETFYHGDTGSRKKRGRTEREIRRTTNGSFTPSRRETGTENEELLLVHRVVLSHDPLAGLVLDCEGEQILIDSELSRACVAGPFTAIVEDYQGRRIFPIHQFPREQRVLRLRTANILRVFLVVIVFPLIQQVVAVAVAHLVQELVRCVLSRAVAQRIHLDADRQPRQRIVILRTREHWSLIAQPPKVADKHSHQQNPGAGGNPNLCAREG